MGRVFANGPGDRGSIPGQVIPKTLKKKKKKWYLILPCITLGIIKYISRVTVFGSPLTTVANYINY